MKDTIRGRDAEWQDDEEPMWYAVDGSDRHALLVAGDALAEHLRIWIEAPSGARICSCRGPRPRCWYCLATSLLLVWSEVTDGH